MKKYFIVLMYKIYDLYVGQKLSSYFRLVKDSNDNLSSFQDSDIKNYLLSYNFNPELEKNPIMTKNEISERLKVLDKNIIHSFAYTGGSYGDPFKIPYSKERTLVRTASFKYFNEIAGYKLGDPFLLIAAKEKPRWLQSIRNENRFVPKCLTEKRIKEIIDLILRKDIKVIIGFPSVIFELAVYVSKNSVKHGIVSVIFTSEPIDSARSLIIKNAFDCIVIDRYSNEEVGLIAQQREFGGVYYTNRYNVLVEILDEVTLTPVKEGELGKVVVTDLKADLVPIIRYDTGDLAVAHEYKDGQLLSLRGISGRTSEQIFTTDGVPVASLVLGPLIHKPLTESSYYNQYQFAQIGPKNFELRIKSKDNLPEIILDRIISNLKNVLGIDAIIELKFLEDIIPQKSGKRPIYKNEWINKPTYSSN